MDVAGPELGSEARGACARHPQRSASVECPICGDYACSECTLDTLWGETLCTGCEARGRAVYPLAWRQRASPRSLAVTARDIVLSAHVVFRNLPVDRPARALAYAACALVPLLALEYLRFALLFTRRWPAVSNAWAYPWAAFGSVLGQALWLVAAALSYFVAVRAVRGRIELDHAVVVVCYASTYSIAANLVSLLPLTSLVAVPLTMLRLYFTAWAFSLTARSRFGLSRERSIVAAVATLVVAALLSSLVALGVGYSGVW
jgi:hypothetical protein